MGSSAPADSLQASLEVPGGRRHSRLVTLLVIVCSALWWSSPAVADVEPNDVIGQAEGGLRGGVTYQGTGERGDPTEDGVNDWYVLSVSGQVELDVAFSVSSGTCSAALSDGEEWSYDETPSFPGVSADAGQTDHLRYTTSPGFTRYFLTVYCNGETEDYAGARYEFQLSPATAIVPQTAPFTSPFLIPEPNERLSSAFGPLMGGTPYYGTIDSGNDEDWSYFFAKGGTTLDISLAGAPECVTSTDTLDPSGISLYEGGVEVATNYAHARQLTHLRWRTSPGRVRRYHVRAFCSEEGDAYSFRVDPAGAILSRSAAVKAGQCRRAKVARTRQKRNVRRLSRAVTRSRSSVKRVRARKLKRARRGLMQRNKEVRRICG